MSVLSTKPIAVVGLDSRISRRVETKNGNKIGDKVDSAAMTLSAVTVRTLAATL